MSKTRLELKVGIFVFICLAIFAALLLLFSKGLSLRRSYELTLDTSNVGGLRPGAMVLMSGVRIGTVSGTDLSPQGTNVAIHLKIYSDYIIHDDALFKIEANGFLGDQFVSIYPGASSDFASPQIKDLASFIKKLRDKSDPVSKYLASILDGDAATLVANYPSTKNATINPNLLMAQFLNRVIAGPPLYTPDRFQNANLRPETVDLLNQRPRGDALMRLNRRLLEDAYPVELGRQGAILKSGDVAHAQEPFNLQEVARSTAGFIERLDNTVKMVDDAISEVRRVVLNDKSLTDLSESIASFRKASETASTTMDRINLIIQTNTSPLSDSVSNLMAFSEGLKKLSQDAQSILATNEPQITAAMNNLQTSTAMLTNLLGEVQAGHGLAGAVVKDQALAHDVESLMNNVAVASSNFNRLGLWHFIWYKPPPTFSDVPPPSKGVSGAKTQPAKP